MTTGLNAAQRRRVMGSVAEEHQL